MKFSREECFGYGIDGMVGFWLNLLVSFSDGLQRKLENERFLSVFVSAH
jgi:hypothetical protein